MNIYFSCSLTGGRSHQATYAAIVDDLLRRGHLVPTAHLARPEVMGEEEAIAPAEVYDRDVAWIEGCDALVAEVSTPSHGVGYEIALALTLGKPALCCYPIDPTVNRGARVSKMITGNRSRGLRVTEYTGADPLGCSARSRRF